MLTPKKATSKVAHRFTKDLKSNDRLLEEKKEFNKTMGLQMHQSERLNVPQSPNRQRYLSVRTSDQKSMISLTSSNTYTQINKHSWLNYQLENKAAKWYIKDYSSSPLEIEVSFLTRAKMETDFSEKQASVKDKFKTFGLSLTNVDEAPLRLNSLKISNIFGTPQEIHFLLSNHYYERIRQNFFTMIGSSNILGNPHNFISHLGTGVQDFFYKPIEGIVQGPLEGGKGLLVGTASLFQNTVQGFFGSTSKITYSLSKGLLFLTDDADYINKREEENREKPKNALEGLGLGLKSTFTGIASGVTGVIENPIRGAQEGGVKGFLVGTYKGTSGLIVKPISGAIDLISKTSEGIKNTATTSVDIKVVKIRILRPFYGKQQLLKSYDQFHAIILQHLKKINRGKYVNDHFIDAMYYDTDTDRNIIVLTEERFLTVNSHSKEVVNEIESTILADVKKIQNKFLIVYIGNGQSVQSI